MNSLLLLSFKAETVMGALLVVRHRTFRWVCALVVISCVVISLQEADRFPLVHQPVTALLISGTLAAFAGSRLFAPGAAFASARRLANAWWVAPIGRLLGSLLVVLPIAIVFAVALNLPGIIQLHFGVPAIVLAAAVASLTYSLAHMVGSSTAVVVTVTALWVGAAPLTIVQAWVDRWPVLSYTIELLWKVLPLSWRAMRLSETPNAIDTAVLLSWIALGVCSIGMATAGKSCVRSREGGTG